MRALVLCQSCRRHVKVSETQCPFCSAEVGSRAASNGARQGLERAQAAGGTRGLPGGRAALFLAGAALAAGCVDDPLPTPVYGVAIDDDSPSTETRDSGIRKDAGPTVRRDAGDDRELHPIPPYGIAIDPVKRDASIATPDAGPSCPPLRNLPVPVYGVGIDIPPRDSCRDSGKDAGADAGKDAGADAGKDAGRDPGLAVPTYGISIDFPR